MPVEPKRVVTKPKPVMKKEVVQERKIICEERAEYQSCVQDKFSTWDRKCKREVVNETVETKPWKQEGDKKSRVESQSTVIEIDSENICDKPRISFADQCKMQICGV